MNKKPRYYLVDDDPISVNLMIKFLKPFAKAIRHNTSSVQALQEIIEEPPDCAILDIMMPELDGLELCKRLRGESGLFDMKIVIVSGKPYEFDRKRAFEFGADGYIIKPIVAKKFAGQVNYIIEDKIEMTFWGVRGTLPAPSKDTIRYGGNTSCMSLDFPRGNLFVFDAGTGIKLFSDVIMKEKRVLREANIFISHPHWDHINALPFFKPLYLQGNEFQICGPSHGDITMRELISAQMKGVYFPIQIKEFGARVYFKDLSEQEFEIDGIKIKTMLLNHPGNCLGYRIEYKDRAICYVTDNELYPADNQFYNKIYIEKLLAFIDRCDALITDCTYTDSEYAKKVCYGHSAVREVIVLADRAKVKTVYLFHHDPDQADVDIDAKQQHAEKLLKQMKSKTICITPMEKQVFRI